MTYWFCITSPENWTVIKNEKIWGVCNVYKKLIKQAKKGDKIIICAVEGDEKRKAIELKICGLFEVESETCKDCKIIFNSVKGELHSNRIRLKPIKIPEEATPVKNLFPELSFGEENHLYTRVMQKIPAKDFEIIERALT
jgi:predicted RNA-binding protein